MDKAQLLAILFDLDGVLLESSRLHFQAWHLAARDEDILLTRQEYDGLLRGVRKQEFLRYLTRGRQYSPQQLQAIDEHRKRYFQDLIDRLTEADVVPGGAALLEEIKNTGRKVAVASAGKHTRVILHNLGLLRYLDGVADYYCVRNNKPSPDIYLYTAGLVGVPVPNCLVIDDKATNIAEVKKTGMYTIGIGKKETFSPDDLTLPSLVNTHLSDLLSLLNMHEPKSDLVSEPR